MWIIAFVQRDTTGIHGRTAFGAGRITGCSSTASTTVKLGQTSQDRQDEQPRCLFRQTLPQPLTCAAITTLYSKDRVATHSCRAASERLSITPRRLSAVDHTDHAPSCFVIICTCALRDDSVSPAAAFSRLQCCKRGDHCFPPRRWHTSLSFHTHFQARLPNACPFCPTTSPTIRPVTNTKLLPRH